MRTSAVNGARGFGLRRGPTRRQAGVLAAAAIAAVAVLLTLQLGGSGDYLARGPVGGDNPAPAIVALSHGELSRLVSEQPVMGLVSIVIRAPEATLTRVTAAGDLTAYKLGAIACLVPLALLFGWLVARAPSSLARIGFGLGALLILIAPATQQALSSGHPEEVLAAVLATVSVLAAQRQAGGVAAVSLGLAVGTKEWAVIAAVPVLASLERGVWRTALKAASVALVMNAPAVLDPSTFAAQDHIVFGSHWSNEFSAWWSLGGPLRLPAGLGNPGHLTKLPLGLTRDRASLIPLVPASGVLLWSRRRRRGVDIGPLAMLALLALVRAVADPLPVSYYFVPVFVGLAVYETAARGRLPLLAAVAVAVESVLFGPSLSPALTNALVLICSAALIASLVAAPSARTRWKALRDDEIWDRAKPVPGRHQFRAPLSWRR